MAQGLTLRDRLKAEASTGSARIASPQQSQGADASQPGRTLRDRLKAEASQQTHSKPTETPQTEWQPGATPGFPRAGVDYQVTPGGTEGVAWGGAPKKPTTVRERLVAEADEPSAEELLQGAAAGLGRGVFVPASEFVHRSIGEMERRFEPPLRRLLKGQEVTEADKKRMLERAENEAQNAKSFWLGMLEVPKRAEDAFTTKAAEVAGSSLTFLGLGAAGTAVGLSPIVAVAAAASAYEYISGKYEALAAGASEDDANVAGWVRSSGGLLEVLPVAKWLERLNRVSGGKLDDVMRTAAIRGGKRSAAAALGAGSAHVGKDAAVEGLQEIVAEVGQSGLADIAQEITTDEDRDIFRNLVEAGKVSGPVGFALSLLSHGPGFARGMRATRPGATAATPSAPPTPAAQAAGAEGVSAPTVGVSAPAAPAVELTPEQAAAAQYERRGAERRAVPREGAKDRRVGARAERVLARVRAETEALLGGEGPLPPASRTEIAPAEVPGFEEFSRELQAEQDAAREQPPGAPPRAAEPTSPAPARTPAAPAVKRAPAKAVPAGHRDIMAQFEQANALAPGSLKVLEPTTPTEVRGAELAKARGARVYVVDAGKPLSRSAAYGRGAILLDANETDAKRARALVLHELTHAVADRSNESLEQLHDRLAALDPEGFRAVKADYLRRFRGTAPEGGPSVTGGKSTATLPRKLRREEGVANYTEELANYVDAALADPTRFVRALGKEGRPLLTRILDALKETANKFGFKLETSQKKALKAIKAELAATPLEQAVAPEVAMRAALAIRSFLDSGLSLATPETETTVEPATAPSAEATAPPPAAQQKTPAAPPAERGVSAPARPSSTTATLPDEVVSEATRAPAAKPERAAEPAPSAAPQSEATRAIREQGERYRQDLDESDSQVAFAVALQEPASSESLPDSVREHADRLRDLLESKPFRAKGLGAFNVPTQRAWLSRVFALGQDAEIRKAVIGSLSVDVVNLLAAEKLPAERLFDDEAVFQNLFSVDSHKPVSLRVDAATAAIRVVARMAAERIGAGGIARSGESTPALNARGRDLHTTGGTYSESLGAQEDVSIRAKFAVAPQRTPGVFLRTFQDRLAGLKEAQREVEAKGALITDANDPALAEELRSGRTKAAMERMRARYVDPIEGIMRRAKIKAQEVSDFLQARHVPERNRELAKLGVTDGSGRTDAWATAELAKVAADPRSAQFERIARIHDRMHREARATWVREGLETQAFVDELEAKYQNYTPLRTDVETDFLGTGTGLALTGRETKRALGRKSAADNSLAFSFTQAATTVVRAEKARADRAVLEFVRTAADPGFATIGAPQVRRGINPKTGLAGPVLDPRYQWKDNVLPVKVGGDVVPITFAEEHTKLAMALKGMNAVHLWRALDFLRRYTRWFTAWATRKNPAFPVFNMLLDVPFAAIKTFGEQGPAATARMLARVPGAWGTIYRAERNLDLRKPSHKLYLRWKNAGGPISSLDLDNYEDTMRKIEKSLGRGPAGFAWDTATEYVGSLADMMENGTRFATFQALVESGMSDKRAALKSKDVSVNFERKGDVGPLMNALYGFWNASVQGIDATAKALKYPRTWKLLASGAASAALLDIIMRSISDEDEDGELFYDKIPEHELRRGIPIMHPDGRGYFLIPIPRGFGWFLHVGTKVGQVAGGPKSPAQAAGDLAIAAMEEFNPFGGYGPIEQGIAPTFADPTVQHLTNRNWYSKSIKPVNYGDRKAESELYYPNVNPTALGIARWLNKVTDPHDTGRGAIDVSPEILEHYAQAVFSGAGRTASQVYDVADKAIRGEPIEARDWPVYGRIVKNPNPFYIDSKYRENTRTVELRTRRLRELEQRDAEEGTDRARAFAEEYGFLIDLDQLRKDTERDLDRMRDDGLSYEDQRSVKAQFNKAVLEAAMEPVESQELAGVRE